MLILINNVFNKKKRTIKSTAFFFFMDRSKPHIKCLSSHKLTEVLTLLRIVSLYQYFDMDQAYGASASLTTAPAMSKNGRPVKALVTGVLSTTECTIL